MQTMGLEAGRKRKLIVASGALFVVLGVLWYLGFIWPTEGPLNGVAGNRAETRAAPDGNTAVFFFPENKTDTTFVLEGASPIGYDDEDLDVLGVGVAEHCGGVRPRGCVDGFSAPQWPPGGIEPHRVAGYVVEPGDQIRIVVGVRNVPSRFTSRLEPGARITDSMFIEGVVVRYRDRFRHYRTQIGPEALFRLELSNRGDKPVSAQQMWRDQF